MMEQLEESRHLETISRTRFVPLDQLKRELERRRELISLMVERGFSTPYVVAKIFTMYHLDPDRAIEAVRTGKI